jgi:hypothetical protein
LATNRKEAFVTDDLNHQTDRPAVDAVDGHTRRTLVRATAAGLAGLVVVGGLAACGGEGEGDDEGEEDDD